MVAVATVLDGRFLTPYFAWAELLFDYENVVKSGGRAVASTMIRRLFYPFAAGFLLVLPLDRMPMEAVGVGTLAIAIMLWPALVAGLPVHLTGGRRDKLLLFYSSLMVLYASASWLGWFAAAALGSLESLWAFVSEQFISLLVTLVLGAFGSLGLAGSTSLNPSTRDDSS